MAQKVSSPITQDWNQLKRVVKYLKATSDMKLLVSKLDAENQSFYGYADAAWAEDKTERKSNNRRIFFLNGGQ